jgi:hypothetical protein
LTAAISAGEAWTGGIIRMQRLALLFLLGLAGCLTTTTYTAVPSQVPGPNGTPHYLLVVTKKTGRKTVSTVYDCLSFPAFSGEWNPTCVKIQFGALNNKALPTEPK